jgi:predicted nucleic acid-binding Zn ribbon protein
MSARSTDAEAAYPKCPKCGETLSLPSQFCPKCGKKILTREEKDRKRAAVDAYRISPLYKRLADFLADRISPENKAVAHELELRLTEKFESYIAISLLPKELRPPNGDVDKARTFALGVLDTIWNENADLAAAIRKQLGIMDPELLKKAQAESRSHAQPQEDDKKGAEKH